MDSPCYRFFKQDRQSIKIFLKKRNFSGTSSLYLMFRVALSQKCVSDLVESQHNQNRYEYKYPLGMLCDLPPTIDKIHIDWICFPKARVQKDCQDRKSPIAEVKLQILFYYSGQQKYFEARGDLYRLLSPSIHLTLRRDYIHFLLLDKNALHKHVSYTRQYRNLISCSWA